MRKLPSEQIGKGQERSLEMLIQPDAKVVQADFGRQTSLKSGENVWTFSRVEQLLKNRLNVLTQASQGMCRDWQKSLLITYNIVRKMSTSIIVNSSS